GGSTPAVRGPAPAAPALADTRPPGVGTQNQSPGLVEPSRPDPARLDVGTTAFRGLGTGPTRDGDLFAFRITAERRRADHDRHVSGFRPTSHVARVRAARQRLLDFDAPPPPAPPAGASDGRIISLPDPASGNGGPLAPLPAGLGADASGLA